MKVVTIIRNSPVIRKLFLYHLLDIASALHHLSHNCRVVGRACYHLMASISVLTLEASLIHERAARGSHRRCRNRHWIIAHTRRYVRRRHRLMIVLQLG